MKITQEQFKTLIREGALRIRQDLEAEKEKQFRIEQILKRKKLVEQELANCDRIVIKEGISDLLKSGINKLSSAVVSKIASKIDWKEFEKNMTNLLGAGWENMSGQEISSKLQPKMEGVIAEALNEREITSLPLPKTDNGALKLTDALAKTLAMVSGLNVYAFFVPFAVTIEWILSKSETLSGGLSFLASAIFSVIIQGLVTLYKNKRDSSSVETSI